LDRVLIEPRRIPGDPVIDHPVLFVLFKPYLEVLRKELKVKKRDVRHLSFPAADYFTTALNGKNIMVFGTPLGAPQAAIMLERLIAMGAGKVLAFGCCGSLQPNLKIGNLVIPTKALSEEGTSDHYPLPAGVEPKADETVVNLCREKCMEEKSESAIGAVWTTDALFRETHEKTERYSREGLLAVEMEMSALFTVAAYWNVRLGGLMTVSDELGTGKWKGGFLERDFWAASRNAARIALKICLGL
jgi:purine-nucleoside phosphorylase